MTKNAMKLLLSIQAKNTGWFLGIYALVMVILLIVFSFVTIDDTSWIPISITYSPKIYLLVIGIIFPLMITKLFVSQGITRKQFFWAYTGTISIISIFLLIPVLGAELYFNEISLASAITQFLQMPLFFLIGWTSVVGFQFKKWYSAMLGVFSAIVMIHSISTLASLLNLSEISLIGLILFLLAALLLILPRIISRVPLKS